MNHVLDRNSTQVKFHAVQPTRAAWQSDDWSVQKYIHQKHHWNGFRWFQFLNTIYRCDYRHAAKFSNIGAFFFYTSLQRSQPHNCCKAVYDIVNVRKAVFEVLCLHDIGEVQNTNIALTHLPIVHPCSENYDVTYRCPLLKTNLVALRALKTNKDEIDPSTRDFYLQG